MVKLLRYIFFPLSILFGLITLVRNFLYDSSILKSSEFEVKTILVGNLSVGGTGKTPQVEYLIRLLQTEFKIATLSRGYGRKTRGFVTANSNSTARDIGDEPLQFKTKFPDVSVNVEASRVNGIIEIMSHENPPDVILLDDAFQHRPLKAGMSILLTEYSLPFYQDLPMPTGNLREFPMGKSRANIVVVTKCPPEISDDEMDKMTRKINPDKNQKVFFSKIKYGKVVSVWNGKSHSLPKNLLLVTGIANPQSLEEFLNSNEVEFTHKKYPDHHGYSEKNALEIIQAFENISATDKIILTTEKDAMRLKSIEKLKNYPVFYIGIEIELLKNKEEFNETIINYVREN